MAAVFAMSGTKISEWLAALQKSAFPRFCWYRWPYCFDFSNIVARCQKYSPSDALSRNCFERLVLCKTSSTDGGVFLIPLLMSAENTATELSATALVRGLSAKNPHTSVYTLRLKLADYVVFGTVLLLIFCL